MGINNRINVALRAENTDDRENRRAALTEAWFADMAQCDQLVVFLFDTYEDATTEVQTWLSGPFLARAAQVVKVRVVVAGQTVPDKNNIEWGHCCVRHDLFGVWDAKHWMPIVQALGKRIDPQPPEVWLAGVCAGLKGNPAEIMKVIEALPQKNPQ
jgi:hypothetical protein